MMVNKESGRMWKEGLVAHLKILFIYLPGGADENHEEPMLGRGLTEI
jgi:hypothetical protein